jgi:putative aminopeptidase FrvX
MNFLKTYINTPSPVGFESGGQKLWMEYIKPYVDTIFTDPYGTAVGVVNPTAPFKVVIEAHCDEISWFVNYINDQGLIYLKRNGGVDHQIAPAKRVLIHGKKGPVKAVFWMACYPYSFKQPGTKRTLTKNRKIFVWIVEQEIKRK